MCHEGETRRANDRISPWVWRPEDLKNWETRSQPKLMDLRSKQSWCFSHTKNAGILTVHQSPFFMLMLDKHLTEETWGKNDFYDLWFRGDLFYHDEEGKLEWPYSWWQECEAASSHILATWEAERRTRSRCQLQDPSSQQPLSAKSKELRHT